jgi:c-di-GMP-binding flagellar brake protein YcgR
MLENKLKVNQKIDIVVENGPYTGTYLSKVAEITKNYLKVTSPFIKGEIVPLRINQDIKVFFTGMSAAFMFESRIISRESKPIALLSITIPEKIVRIQRREYFRVEAKKKVKYRVIDTPDKEEEGNQEEELIETVTVDISGGGVKMVVDDQFPSSGMIKLYLDLPEIENETIYGEIVNLYALPDGRAAGINFTEIDDHTREQIITWLFHYQRELRQKGLL